MEHLDLALSRQQEAVYSSNDESCSSMMSERVSSLATSIYAEFERMIAAYGQEVLENLMPMVVNVLEQLDSAYTDENERTLELELISEDNEQLITQYEREKQLRKLAESKFLEYEDSHEQEKRDLQNEVESLEHQNRQSESKLKNLHDHVERLEERLSEQKKEYATLHQRHSEMIQSFMERMEHHSKLSPGMPTGSTDSPFVFRRQPCLSIDNVNTLNISASQPNLAVKSSSNLDLRANLGRSASIQSDIPPQATGSRNDLSFEDEVFDPKKEQGDTHEKEGERKDDREAAMKSKGTADTAEMSTSTTDLLAVGSEKHVTSTPLRLATVPEDQIASMQYQGDNVHGVPVMSLNEAELSMIGTSETREAPGAYPTNLSQEAQAILDTTPELTASQLSVDLIDRVSAQSSIPPDMKSARERMNRLSLFAELSSQEPALVGEIDNGSNLNQVGKELETLINENEELLGVRNKLTTQKNDLLMRVKEISSEKEMLQDEIGSLQTTKGRMKLKISELEQDLKKTKHELEKAHIAMKNKSTEDRVSSANRKRFTRVEMARVLMERNQYKERLMELQEAVRWTEMIRATKENHMAAIQQKKKSSVWKFFSNLFAGGSSSSGTPVPRRSLGQQPVSIWYGARASPSSSIRRHSSIGTPNRETGLEGLTERQRQERRERYKFVKEHINSEGRLQAYGWSLPATYNTEQDDFISSPVPVPIPVYCRPLNTDPAMKIWCAAGINLAGGRNKEGSLIGMSPDYQEPSMSTVWIGTSTHSCSKITIIDSNTPATAKEHFIVCSSHLLCMSAVPGVNEDDYNYYEGLEERDSKGEAGSGRRTPIAMIGRANSVGSVPRNSQEFYDLTTESVESTGSITGIQVEEEAALEEDQTDGSVPKPTSALPTMWLGAQSGKVYIHSVILNSRKCLQSAKLKDSVLSIVHIKGRVLAALADGTVAIFHRRPDGRWDLSNYHLLDLGRPHHSIRCMTAIHGKVWCGYRNKIQVINPQNMRIEKTFDAHPRRESQVRQLAHIGDGVWVSIRLDSTLRLYNAHTYHHLQDIDIEPYVSKMLGTGKLGFSFVRITALLLTHDRLWVGTGNGVVLSIPLVSSRPCREDPEQSRSIQTNETMNGSLPRGFNTNGKETKFMPYCSMVRTVGKDPQDSISLNSTQQVHAQLSFHGHRDSVKFFVAVPGSASNVTAAKAYSMAGAPPPSPSMVQPSSPDKSLNGSMLVMSGGEGYIDFRVGDDENEEPKPSEESVPLTSKVMAAERSHLLVWQVTEG